MTTAGPTDWAGRTIRRGGKRHAAGIDTLLGTGDGQPITLSGYTREIKIRDDRRGSG